MADDMESEQPPDRMPLPAASGLSDDQKRALAEFAEGRGYTARGPFVPLLRSPRLLTATRAILVLTAGGDGSDWSRLPCQSSSCSFGIVTDLVTLASRSLADASITGPGLVLTH